MQRSGNIKEIKKILLRYKHALENDNFPVRKIILYGSYAKGGSRSYSDIDVCVVSNKFLKNKDLHETYLWKKVLGVDRRIEPVGYHPRDFNTADPLVYEIKKHGIEIK